LRAVTIKDVAREADVSVASVSRVLNGVGRVGAATRSRILDTAERLRYVPHEGARSLITRRTDTIGMILPDLHGEFFSELLRGADAAARARGFHLLVSTSHGSVAEAAGAIRSMRGRVDGLIIMSPQIAPDPLALPDGLPVVLMNAPLGAGRSGVAVQNYEGALAMVRHLGITATRIAHISGPEGNGDAGERLRGYLDARPLDLGPDYVVRGDFTAASGYRAGLELAGLDPMPQAVFAANDMMAAGCIEAFAELGVRVPDDVAIGGFDDVPLARFLRPALTTMRVDLVALGAKAFERLSAELEQHGRDSKVDQVLPELVVRSSCGQGLGREQEKKCTTGPGRYPE
jgi:LacI family transcriptional regulator